MKSFETILNWLMVIFCLIGFTYQVYLIVYEFSLGKTVVNVEVKLLTNTSLPGVTVCYPVVLSMTKASKMNEYKEVYSKFSRMVYINQNKDTLDDDLMYRLI